MLLRKDTTSMTSSLPAAALAAVPDAAKGYAHILRSFRASEQPTVPNNTRLQLMQLQGPWNNAKPETRMGIFSVRRFNDGQLANNQWENGIRIQAATEALSRAGVLKPTLAFAKATADAHPYVAVGDKHSYPVGVYGNLPLDKQTYFGAAVTPALSATPPDPAVVATFSNGVSMVKVPCPGRYF